MKIQTKIMIDRELPAVSQACWQPLGPSTSGDELRFVLSALAEFPVPHPGP